MAVIKEVWEQQFEWDEGGSYEGPREKLEGHGLIQSPHEPEVHYREKRDKNWQGYVGQVSETAAEKGEVNFITDIGVTDAQASDVRSLPEVQKRLAEREVAPEEQDVDQAYVSGTSLAQSEAQGIKLVGPIAPQVGPKAYKLSDFEVELEEKKATCPAGQTAVRWHEVTRSDGTVEYRFYFGKQCTDCPLRDHCTEAKTGRTITYHEHHQQVVQCRKQMETEAFKMAMKHRARSREPSRRWPEGEVGMPVIGGSARSISNWFSPPLASTSGGFVLLGPGALPPVGSSPGPIKGENDVVVQFIFFILAISSVRAMTHFQLLGFTDGLTHFSQVCVI